MGYEFPVINLFDSGAGLSWKQEERIRCINK